MKILVVDDTKLHLDAAKEQLSGIHELTLASGFSEARKLIWGEKVYREVESYDFDVILTDYLMPSEKDGLGPNGGNFNGQLMPYGLTLALIALSTSLNVKVAIVSAGIDHHSHPMVWAADPLSGVEMMGRLKLFIGYNGETPMRKMVSETEKCDNPECHSGKCARNDGSTYDCVYCNGDGKLHYRVKDWEKALSTLLLVK